MKRICLRALPLWLGLALAAASRAQAEPPHKYALLIGMNHIGYSNPGIERLEYAINDVEDLRKALKRLGYEVTLLGNENAKRESVMMELSRHLAMVGPADDFLLYYAGHGVRNKSINGKTYWLTYDARLEALDVAGIRLPHLLDYIADIRAQRKLVLLDHCFSGDLILPASVVGPSRGAGARAGGPRAPGERSDEPRLERGASPLSEINDSMSHAGQGVILIAAARGSAFEVKKYKHGLFTYALLQALNTRGADTNKDAKLSVDELTVYLKSKVHELSNGTQETKELTSAADTHEWFVTERLPVEDAKEATDKAAVYQRTLSEWEQKRWITSDTKSRCWEVLQKWPSSMPPGPKALFLGEEEQQLVDKIREAIDAPDKTAPEKIRAGYLNDFVKNLREGGDQ